MKISSEWPRIVGLHAEHGRIACVWVAHDKSTDRIFVYDTAVFQREVFAVIAERIKGPKDIYKAIPIAWEMSAEEVVKKLKDRGCRPLIEGYRETDALAEVIAREMWGQMEARQFLVGAHNKQWFDERERFWLSEDAVPLDGFPLMSATRHAVINLKKAKVMSPVKKKIHYDNAGIV